MHLALGIIFVFLFLPFVIYLATMILAWGLGAVGLITVGVAKSASDAIRPQGYASGLPSPLVAQPRPSRVQRWRRRIKGFVLICIGFLIGLLVGIASTLK